jgi:drug/metabolite transporter (DMT)-like permease
MQAIFHSIKKNLKGIIIIIFAAVLTSIGQLFWKLSYNTNIKWLILGFICYGVGAVCMIVAFRYGNLSVLHPMLSTGYIFALILGRVILKEQISLTQIIAIIIIIIGVTLIGGGDV